VLVACSDEGTNSEPIEVKPPIALADTGAGTPRVAACREAIKQVAGRVEMAGDAEEPPEYGGSVEQTFTYWTPKGSSVKTRWSCDFEGATPWSGSTSGTPISAAPFPNYFVQRPIVQVSATAVG